MNVFAVALVGDPSLAPAVQHAIATAHQRSTPFADVPHDARTWAQGRVVAASWSIHAHALSRGACSSAGDGGFHAITGLPRHPDHAGGGIGGVARAQAWAGGGLDPRELGGVWTLVRATGSEVEVRTSLTGSEPVYVARRPGLVLVSNRASLARLAAWPDQPVRYDTDALIPLCARGWLAHDRVPFSGLSLLGPGSRLVARPDGVRIERTHHLDAHVGGVEHRGSVGPGVGAGDGRLRGGLDGDEVAPTPAELAAVYDRIAEELLAGARAAADLGLHPQLELTGDVVTRLSAAVYAAAGVEVTAVTPHPPDDPHSVVAREVADLVGVPHRCAPVAVEHRQLTDALERQVRQGEGVSNLFDPCPPLRTTPELEVVRHAGGALLGGYDNLASGPRPPVTDVDEGRRFLDNLTLHNGGLLLRTEARIAQSQVNRRVAEELLDETGRLSFHELAYLRLREGRGTGANRQAAAYGAVQVAPLLDDRVLVHLAELPLEHKRSQRAAFELIERLAPALARHRFVGSRWRFEAEGPDPMLDPDTWAQREPLPATAASAGWRVTADGRLPATLARRLEDPGPLLSEIIDRRRVAQVLRGGGPLEHRDVLSLYGAATAQHLFAGAWLAPAREGRGDGRLAAG